MKHLTLAKNCSNEVFNASQHCFIASLHRIASSLNRFYCPALVTMTSPGESSSPLRTRQGPDTTWIPDLNTMDGVCTLFRPPTPWGASSFFYLQIPTVNLFNSTPGPHRMLCVYPFVLLAFLLWLVICITLLWIKMQYFLYTR
jgi:hypothetical protein